MSSDTTPQLSPESLSKYRASLRLKMQARFQDALERLEDASDDVVTRRLFRTKQQQAERNPLDSWGQSEADQEVIESLKSGPGTGASEASFTGLGSFPFTPPALTSRGSGGGSSSNPGEASRSGSSSSGSCYSVASPAPKFSRGSGSSQAGEDVSVELARGVSILRAERRPVISLRRKSTDADVVFGRVDQLGQELAKMLEDATATRPGRMSRTLSGGQLSPMHPFTRQGARSPLPYQRPVAPQ